MVNKRLWYEPSVVRFSKVKLPVVMLLIAFIFGRHFARSSHFFSLYKAAVSEGVLSRFGGSLDGRSAYDGSRKRRRLENGMEWGYEDRYVCLMRSICCVFSMLMGALVGFGVLVGSLRNR